MNKVFVALVMMLPAITLADSNTSTVTNISWQDIGAEPNGLIHYVILGQLGLPLGKVVTIEGVAPKGGPKFNPTTHLLVDTVDGRALPDPCSVYLGDRSKIQPDKRYVLVGYDTGGFAGDPDDVFKYTNAFPAQQGFRFTTRFVVIKDISTNSTPANPPK